jgi:hypothetical protein
MWLTLGSFALATPSNGPATTFSSAGVAIGAETSRLCDARQDDGAPLKHDHHHSQCALCACFRDLAFSAFLTTPFTTLASRSDSTTQLAAFDRERCAPPIGRPSYSFSRAPPSIV